MVSIKQVLPDEFDPNLNCSVCNKVFGKPKSYRRHLKDIHKMQVTRLKPTPDLNISPNPNNSNNTVIHATGLSQQKALIVITWLKCINWFYHQSCIGPQPIQAFYQTRMIQIIIANRVKYNTKPMVNIARIFWISGTWNWIRSQREWSLIQLLLPMIQKIQTTKVV